MSTPAQLLNELRALLGHYDQAAKRKALIIAEMNGNTDGLWTCVLKVRLKEGKLYFVRIHTASGFRTPAAIRRWESHGWVPVYGTEHKVVEGDRLQVLVPKISATASSRRRSQGRKS